MKTALIVTLTILVAVLVEALAVQAAPSWLVPPGGTLPPEPEPLPGDSDSGPCPSADVLSPRWFLPWVAL